MALFIGGVIDANVIIALERSRCRPENAVMIGDRIDNDIVPAKQLGMKTIWVNSEHPPLEWVLSV